MISKNEGRKVHKASSTAEISPRGKRKLPVTALIKFGHQYSVFSIRHSPQNTKALDARNQCRPCWDATLFRRRLLEEEEVVTHDRNTLPLI